MSECPVDLSSKFRSVSVQTEIFPSAEKLQEYLLQVTLDLLANKNNLEKFNKNIIKLITGIKKSQECSTPLSLPDEWTISQPESIPITYNNNIHLALDVPESVPNLGLNTMGLNLSNDSHIFLNNYRTENLQDDIRRAQEDDLLRRQHDDAHHRQHEDIRIHQEDIHRQHDDIHSQHDIHHRHHDDIHHGHHEDINRGHHDDIQGCYDSTLHRGPTVSSLVSIGTVNSECLNRKLSSVNFDTESTGSHSDTSGTSGGGGRKSRDDKVIYELSIPFTADRIINCSMDDFNNMLVSNGLTEEQINTCRDIRRRGKNKIAAQNCRKRKVDQITNLAEEVDAVREKKTRILDEQEQLTKTLSIWRSKMKRLESYVLQRLGHDPGDWALEVVEENDQVTLVPRGIR